MEKKIIAVVGATGLQGNGVVNALIKQASFTVRALTRNVNKYQGKADEVMQADLTDIRSLIKAFTDTYGVFVVTNFWEDADEAEQLKTAIEAAKLSGVTHFIWSTLPNVKKISNGQFEVPQFTGKAEADDLVKNAGFENYTFVQPPFYFQNFQGHTAPQQQQDDSTGWTLPIDPTKKVIHMADINDLGKVVAGAFLHPEEAGNGSYLSVATELNSFNDVLEAFKANGRNYTFHQVPSGVFSNFFEGAQGVAQLLAYFEIYTYMGPNSDSQVLAAKQIATEPFIPLKEWIKDNSL